MAGSGLTARLSGPEWRIPMRGAFLLVAGLWLFAAPVDAGAGPASLSGHARSVLYLYEADAPAPLETRAQALQYLRLDFRPGLASLSLHTYGSVRGDWSDEPFDRGRLYFGYLEWAPSTRFGGGSWVRAGRQLVMAGVGTGTVDGIAARAALGPGVDLTAFAGTLGAGERDGVTLHGWDESSRFGAMAGFRPHPEWHLAASYAVGRRDGHLTDQLLGAHLRAEPSRLLTLYADARHQFATRTLIDLTGGVTAGAWRGWTLWGEMSRRNPDLPADSFFSVFDARPNKEARAQLSRAITPDISATAGYEATLFDDETTHRVRVGPATRWGGIGFVWSDGAGARQASLYANGRAAIGRTLSAHATFNYFDYDFGPGTLRDSSALTAAGGLEFRPTPAWSLAGRVEALRNRLNEYDVRFLGEIRRGFRVGGGR